MSAKNDVTGDLIQSRGPTDAYREGWERIFNGGREVFVGVHDCLRTRHIDGRCTKCGKALDLPRGDDLC